MRNVNLSDQPYMRRGKNKNRIYKNGSIRNFFIIMLLVCLLALSGYRFIQSLMFNMGCKNYLKTAADAGTIELATNELESAINYLRNNNLTSGCTSLFFYDRTEDVGFFYTNLSNTLRDLKSYKTETSKDSPSTILLRLRNTLLDEGKGATVTVPAGISVYPHNKEIAFSYFILISSLIVLLAFGEKKIFSQISLTELIIVLSIIGLLAALTPH